MPQGNDNNSNKKKKRGTFGLALERVRKALQPIQPRGRSGFRAGEKQDVQLPGGRDKGIAIPRRRRPRQ